MCEVDDEDLFGYKATEKEWRHALDGEGRAELEKQEEGAEEEGVKARVKIVNDKPSRREIEEHMATHIPFRSWCPHCVRGKRNRRTGWECQSWCLETGSQSG